MGLGLILAAMAFTGCGRQAAAEAKPEGDLRGTPIAQATGEAAKKSVSSSVPVPLPIKPAPASASDSAWLPAGFDKISGYVFEVSDELLGPITNEVTAAMATVKTDAMIPKSVHELNNKNVAIKGFMLPLKVEGGVVTELLIMKDQSMCCYGSTPKINEWVSVKMKGKGVKPLMDQPVTLFGTLRVGETRENGYLVGIYRLDGERMEVPQE